MSDKLIKRQILDQLTVINDREKFSMKEHIKANVTLSNFEEFTKTKRIAYNYKIAELLKRNSLCPDDLYDRLDAIWKVLLNDIEKKRKTFSYRAIKVINMVGRNLFALAQDQLAFLFSTFWDAYLNKTYIMVESYLRDN